MNLDKLTKNLTWLTVLGTVLAGCPADDGDGTTAAETGTTDATAGTNPTTTMSMTSAEGSTTVEPGTTTASVDSSGTAAVDSSGTAAGTEGSGTAAETGTGGSGGDICAPDGMDDECAACTKEMCCAELTTCEANPDCACLVQCVNAMGMGNGGVPACLTECMLQGLPDGALELSACSMGCDAC